MKWALLLTLFGCTAIAPRYGPGIAIVSPDGLKREAYARFDSCMGSQLIVDGDTVEGCVSEALEFCAESHITCSAMEFKQHYFLGQKK